jgi:NADH dehydrogenase/NADH:ubiquinone oxidoreductase subunit G
VIHPGERPDFGAVQAGLTPAEVVSEAARCLSCGCADYFECKLVDLANKYGAEPEKFSPQFHKKTKHKIDRSNFHFHRDMNKCVLCGLCVSVCTTVSDKEAISAVNRGFDTTIAAAFEQPLQNRDECTICGNCVARCPVGALTEVSPMPKQLVVREDITDSICTMCGNGCEIKFSSKAGQILRILPADAKTLCEKGRFSFTQLGEKIFTPLVKREGILRRATLPEAAKAINEGFNVLKAQYGAESIGVAISPRYVSEDISAIIKYAEYIGTPHVFTLTDTSNDELTHCNTGGLKNLGVSTDNKMYSQMINSGEIKGLISFGDELKSIENPPEFLVLQSAYASALSCKIARTTSVILPAPALGEVSGTIVNEKTGNILQINPAFQPLCGSQVRKLVQALSVGDGM